MRNLRKRRQRAGLTLAQLAARAGVNAVHLSRIELGLAKPLASTVRRIEAGFTNPRPPASTVGPVLRACRAYLGWSIAETARRAQLSAERVWLAEKNLRALDRGELRRLLRALDSDLLRLVLGLIEERKDPDGE